MSRSIFHDDAHERQFQDKGFIVLPLLDMGELNEMRTQFDTLKPDDNFAPPDNRYHCTFLDTNSQYKSQCFNLFQSRIMPRLANILRDYDLLVGNFYVKNPGGSGEFQVHQNWDLLDKRRHTALTAWIPFQDTTRMNGTIEFVEGSHKIFPNIAAPNVDFFFKLFENRVKSEYCQACDMKAGDVVIFDDELIHYSRANYSSQRRISIQLELVPREAQPLIYYCDPANPGLFEVFESNSRHFVENNQLFARPANLKFVKNIPNTNRLYSEEEFVDCMRQGDILRRRFYGQAAPSACS